MEQHSLYEATVRIRRGEGWDVRPEADAIDGSRYTFIAGWQCDTDERYPGEWAMLPHGVNLPVAWIASGDLVDITPAPLPRRRDRA